MAITSSEIPAIERGVSQDLQARPSGLAADVWAGRRHVLDLDDFSRDEIELVFQTADEMKEVLPCDGA